MNGWAMNSLKGMTTKMAKRRSLKSSDQKLDIFLGERNCVCEVESGSIISIDCII
jgi:hypothetical protein